MRSSNEFGFKEWAAVCAALNSGRQSLILRKGGIHEDREGFRVAHDEFWLMPTHFHQEPEALTPEAAPLLSRALFSEPPPGTIRVENYAVVEEVFQIMQESRLPALCGLHVWSQQTLSQRFHYRAPGLFALAVRVYRRPEPFVLPDSPHLAGCRSWVELPSAMSTDGLQPVLADLEHERQMHNIRTALAADTVA